MQDYTITGIRLEYDQNMTGKTTVHVTCLVMEGNLQGVDHPVFDMINVTAFQCMKQVFENGKKASGY